MTTIDNPAVQLGSQFAGYRLERILGSGSYGVVYLAEETNPQLQRRVALKILRPELANDAAFRERFFRESRLVARLEPHPAIVAVYDAGIEHGLLWIASRYVEGMDLRTVLEQRGRLEPQRTAVLVQQVGDALDAAHRDGLVHRDVKPGNILISNDLQRAYLADFGLSKKISSNADNSLTRAGEFLGTVLYASPEQLSGGEVSGRSDLYALGCVTFEMLAGRAPFEGGVESVILAHINKRLPDVTAFDHQLPPGVNAVIHKATTKRAEDRYATCAEYTAAVYRAIGRGDSTVVPVPGVPATAMGSGPPGAQPPAQGPAVTAPPAATAPPAPQPVTAASPPASAPVWTPTSPPPPAGPAKAGGKKTVALVGGPILAVLLVVVAIGAWRALSPDPFPDEQEQELLAAVPAEFRDNCTRDESPARDVASVLAAVQCLPSEGAHSAAFRQLETVGTMNDAFDGEIAGAPITLPTEGDCSVDVTAVHGFVTTKGDEGQLACYRDGANSHLVWTVEGSRILGTAQRNDHNDLTLYNSWAGAYGVEQAEISVEQPELSDEDVLRSHVPSAIEGTCTSDDLGLEEALASLRCEPTGTVAYEVLYVSWATVEDMQADHQANLDDLEVSGDAGDVGECPAEFVWVHGSTGDEPGRVGCGLTDSDEAVLFWTDERVQITTVAFAEADRVEELWDWWAGDGGHPILEP